MKRPCSLSVDIIEEKDAMSVVDDELPPLQTLLFRQSSNIIAL